MCIPSDRFLGGGKVNIFPRRRKGRRATPRCHAGTNPPVCWAGCYQPARRQLPCSCVSVGLCWINPAASRVHERAGTAAWHLDPQLQLCELRGETFAIFGLWHLSVLPLAPWLINGAETRCFFFRKLLLVRALFCLPLLNAVVLSLIADMSVLEWENEEDTSSMVYP